MSELEEYAEQDSYFSDWLSDNREELKLEFLDKQTPPILDDDRPDFFENNYDEFMAYAKKQFRLEEGK